MLRRGSVIALLTFLVFQCFSQTTLTGRIQDTESGNPLIGVRILVKGTSRGTLTQNNGEFSMKVASLPATLVCTYFGYEDTEQVIEESGNNIVIKMSAAAFEVEAVEIRGQSVAEKSKNSALTVESMGPLAIEQTASENFYDGLGALKGVDLTSASLGVKVINTRGFNSTAPVRILQTIDGVDNASPSVNFALGNFLGSSELDLQSVDLIVGASSAFYGPNAFNGVIKMDSKDPFLSQGLSAFVKAGERNIIETGVRWAQSFANKDGDDVFAYKVNFTYLTADDWEAQDYTPVDSSKVPETHYAGFDAVNIYGDEYDPVFDLTQVAPWSTRGMTIFYRNGYREDQLLEYETDNYKANMSMNVRLKPSEGANSPELIWANNFSQGSTIFQGAARFRLLNVRYLTSRLELRQRDKFFLRAYVTGDDVGQTYNPYATAQKLNEYAKENNIWSSLYTDAWLSNFGARAVQMGYPLLEIINGQPFYDREAREAFFQDPAIQDSLARWHARTIEIVNASTEQGTSAFLEPGTPEFQEQFDRITTTLTSEGGSKFFTSSEVYHVQGEYKFEPSFLENFRVGGSFRLFTPDTRGTIFADTSDLFTITNREFGFYMGMEKKLIDDRLTLSLTGRVDKNQNFNWISTPAASAVFNPADNHYIRLSFSSAVRNPTLPDQYFWLDVGPAIFAGSVNGFDSLLTVDSFEDYALNLDANKLDYFDVDPIQPERVRTFEIGYRNIFNEALYLDASYYYNVYNQFLGFRVGLDVDFNQLGLPSNVQVLRASANAESQVTTQGFAIGLNYFFKDYYQLSGNYTWNKLNTATDDEIIPAFNTPEHKFNISFSGRNVPIYIGGIKYDNLGFNINYKWVESFIFEGSPQFTGIIPRYDLLDIQANYEFPKIKTTVKIGASNILQNDHIETVGGPLIGRLAYIKLSYQLDR
jgi:iron complex outermembrane receptor protein